MPIDANDISINLVNILRARFIDEANTNPEDYDPQDVHMIETTERFLRRFLRHKNCDIDESFDSMVAALKWRKEIGVRQLDVSLFPREYFQIGGVFPYGKDMYGSTMIIFRVKVNKKFTEWTDTLKKYIAFLVETEDKRVDSGESRGIAIVFDCVNAGITNLNIDLLSFITSIVRDYYPSLLNLVLVKDLPLILQWVFKLVQTWLPEDQKHIISLVTNDNITEYVDEEELPDFLGGSSVRPYRTNPKNAPTIQELAEKLNIKKKEADKLQKHLEQFLYD